MKYFADSLKKLQNMLCLQKDYIKLPHPNEILKAVALRPLGCGFSQSPDASYGVKVKFKME